MALEKVTGERNAQKKKQTNKDRHLANQSEKANHWKAVAAGDGHSRWRRGRGGRRRFPPTPQTINKNIAPSPDACTCSAQLSSSWSEAVSMNSVAPSYVSVLNCPNAPSYFLSAPSITSLVYYIFQPSHRWRYWTKHGGFHSSTANFRLFHNRFALFWDRHFPPMGF